MPDTPAAPAEGHTVPVTFLREGVTLHAQSGITLRDLALAHGINPHPHVRKLFNCGGIGDCTTCVVRLAAEPAAVNPPTAAEAQWRDRWPADWRLSCQVRVTGPISVETRPRRPRR
ncbi:MAG: (2Fe-2S)-binding protein [Candidatus Sericytochromatia bacterium]|nr:(2Fe-2S)-binding protein [Candidatus Sericytochromatia bacterium]